MGNFASTLNPVLGPLDSANGLAPNAGSTHAASTNSAGVCTPRGGPCSLSKPFLNGLNAPCCAGLTCSPLSTASGTTIGLCVTGTSDPILQSVFTTMSSAIPSAVSSSGTLGSVGLGGILSGQNVGGALNPVTSILSKGGMNSALNNIGASGILSEVNNGIAMLSQRNPQTEMAQTTMRTVYYKAPVMTSEVPMNSDDNTPTPTGDGIQVGEDAVEMSGPTVKTPESPMNNEFSSNGRGVAEGGDNSDDSPDVDLPPQSSRPSVTDADANQNGMLRGHRNMDSGADSNDKPKDGSHETASMDSGNSQAGNVESDIEGGIRGHKSSQEQGSTAE